MHIIIAGLALVFCGIVFAACEDAREWSEFKSTHHCELTGKQRMRNRSQYNGNVVVTTIVAVDEWSCDHGVIRWRDAK